MAFPTKTPLFHFYILLLFAHSLLMLCRCSEGMEDFTEKREQWEAENRAAPRYIPMPSALREEQWRRYDEASARRHEDHKPLRRLVRHGVPVSEIPSEVYNRQAYMQYRDQYSAVYTPPQQETTIYADSSSHRPDPSSHANSSSHHRPSSNHNGVGPSQNGGQSAGENPYTIIKAEIAQGRCV